MKILFFVISEYYSQNGNIGGNLAQSIGVIQAFKKLGHEVIYLSRKPVPFISEDEYQFEPLPTMIHSIPKVRALVNQWNNTRKIQHLIRYHSPSLIYCRWQNNLFISHLKKYNIPIVMVCNTPHTMHNDFILNKYYDKLNIKTADLVLPVSDVITNHFKKMFGDIFCTKVITNPNGVDTERFTEKPTNIREELKIPDSVPIIGFSGYFMPWHNIDILIKAVQQYHANVRLLLIGNGEITFEKKLRDQAGEYNKERIIFTGPVSYERMPEFLSACDILIVPQDKRDNHRSPIKLFEYMAIGKAIAAANVGQLKQVIIDGINGLLFEPDVESIKIILNKLITDNGLRKRLGEKARQDAVYKYSWEANIKRTLSALHIKQ
jgi:glycosyltransferase involved in cell wall biosynthesis